MIPCPHCEDGTATVQTHRGEMTDRCATCSGTCEVDACCNSAEAEPVYPVVESDDWLMRCLSHGCSVCGVAHVPGTQCVSGGV